MNKILVVSDSHRDTNILNDLLIKYYDFDYYLHLGDSELPAFLISPFASVKGNCDHEYYPPTKTLIIDNIKIYYEHGLSLLFDDIEYIKSKNCNIFLYGHTHMHSIKKLNNTIICNPGSLTRPRDNTKGTYLIITIDKNHLEFKIFDINHLLIKKELFVIWIVLFVNYNNGGGVGIGGPGGNGIVDSTTRVGCPSTK